MWYYYKDNIRIKDQEIKQSPEIEHMYGYLTNSKSFQCRKDSLFNKRWIAIRYSYEEKKKKNLDPYITQKLIQDKSQSKCEKQNKNRLEENMIWG